MWYYINNKRETDNLINKRFDIAAIRVTVSIDDYSKQWDCGSLDDGIFARFKNGKFLLQK